MSSLSVGCGEAEPDTAKDDSDVDGDDTDGDDTDQPAAPSSGTTKPDAGVKAAVADAGRGVDGGKKPGLTPAKPDGGPGEVGEGGMPPMTEPAADGMKYGDWTYYEVNGALCRDGSKAGYYIREGSKNVMMFLMGGGACTDSWFCAINPYSVNQTLPSETLLAAVGDLVGQTLIPQRQQPTDDGIFKKDPANPVGDWTQIYVPYCTGDVHAGTKKDGLVPKAPELKGQQFVGYNNIGLFLEHFGKAYKGKAEKVLLTGSSAGSFGALLNFDRTQEFFGSSTKVFVLADSGIAFTDKYMEPCLQKQWRELWGLDGALPKDCKGCFNADGGGMATGLGDYLFRQKYKDRPVMGGGMSAKEDEVIKLFFSAGLNNCDPNFNPEAEAVPAALGLGSYPSGRYPMALKDFLDNVAGRERAGSYIMDGTLHQHIFRPRYYQDLGLGKTIAEWVGDLLNEKATHVGTL